MKTELPPPTPTSTIILSIFLPPTPSKLLFTWCVEFHIVLKCLFQSPPTSIPFYYFWKAYPHFAYGNSGKEHSLWGQKAQPLNRPAYKLEQNKWG